MVTGPQIDTGYIQPCECLLMPVVLISCSDCSVSRFDDLELAAYDYPPPTPVRQSSYRLGQGDMRMMLQLIQSGFATKGELLPTKLVVRESTGPAHALPGGREGR